MLTRSLIHLVSSSIYLNCVKNKPIYIQLNIKYHLTVFYILVSLALNLKGQDIKFRHLSTSDGLSHVSVLTLYMDENHHIWIGTREGLNRYDGLNIESYKLQENNPRSLFSNNIQKITGDKQGKLYILSTEGISKYDIAKDEFSILWEDNDIKSFYYSDNLYIGRGKSIYLYNEEKNEFSQAYTLPIEASSISSLFIDNKNGQIYAGTNIGLYVINKDNSIEYKIKTDSPISDIYKDDDNDIWISSWDDGVFRLSGNQITQLTHHTNDKNSIASNFVRSCYQDNQGNVWIATFHGLDKFNKKTQNITHYKPNKKADGLSHSSIWSIIKDHQGTLWLGTYFGGVNYFNPEYLIYTQYEQSNNQQEGLSSPIVGRMTEDGKNNLWICTEGAGVNVLNRATGTFRWYLPDRKNSNSIAHNNVKAIYYDKKNNAMWFGTHLGGLDRLDLNSDRFTHFKHNHNDNKSIPSNIVRDIVPYRNKLLLATDNGIGVFDIATGECTHLFEKNSQKQVTKDAFDLHLDHLDNLWISVAGEGVYRYNFKTKELKNFRHRSNDPKSLSNNNINSINQDSRNILYFCTSGRGIDVFDYETETFKNYDSEKNGLISDFVYNILEASHDDYLIITNRGFSRLNPNTGKFQNYNMKNGFPLSTINDNAIFLTSDKKVFLGGVDGLVSFYLKNLSFSPKEYDIRFSRLYVNNKEVKAYDNTYILKQSFLNTSAIELKDGYNIFEIEVSTTNYIPSNREELVYQLKGFSDEWMPLRSSRITFTNLNAGNYTLIVKSNNDLQPHTNTVQLDIKILPPLYRSPLAYFCYVILFFLIFIYLVRSHDKRIKLQASLAYEQKHLQDVERLNQSKLRFFTNISHEFRTPLTIIVGQLDYLINNHNFASDIYNKILSAYKNSVQMKDLISELLDFRKQELGHMTISVSEHDIVQFVKENYLLFEEYAKTKNITFSFKSNVDRLNVWYDNRQLQKVINNLLSNAFKHTPDHGSIELSILKEDRICSICISDSGIGIKQEDIDKIFNSFYQVDNSENTGSGIGLALTKGIIELHGGSINVESKIQKGSVFKITLLLGNKHFAQEQISTHNTKEKAIDQQAISTLKDFTFKDIEVSPTLKNTSDSKILIVEDNDDLRNMLTDVFSPFYTVINAPDGKAGLELIYSETPDIIVSDIVMPNMTGIELCKIVKSDINICHIPLILLTAKTSVEHNLEGLGIGADDYITKPFEVEILLARCNNLINSRKLLQQIFSTQPDDDVDPTQLTSNSLDQKLIEQAKAIIEENMDNIDFSIVDFSKKMGMSRTNLFTKIKALTGQTPNAFIMTMRLKRAAHLLRNNHDLNISEISIITGFNTSHYFSKCFKDTYKQTPTEYREKHIK